MITFNQDAVIESIINGQMHQAKQQLQHGCKTRPEKQAYRLGRVVGALCDPDGSYKQPDLAVRFLALFKG